MEKFKALAESLVEKYNVSVFFIGTAFERDLLSKVENVDKNIFNFAGRFNPLELAAFLSLSSCVIGIDSSPVYIASSTRTTSCIALYGAGSPFRKIAFPEKFYPISAKNPPCSPCSKRFCKLRNDEYAPCMDNISVDDVMSVIDKEKLLQLNENLI
jgi:ADP-heptose:LPS heptosyltransferase